MREVGWAVDGEWYEQWKQRLERMPDELSRFAGWNPYLKTKHGQE